MALHVRLGFSVRSAQVWRDPSSKDAFFPVENYSNKPNV